MNRRRWEVLSVLGALAAMSGCSSQVVGGVQAVAPNGTQVPVKAASVQLILQSGHNAPVGAAVFTPDGAMLITHEQDGTLKFWRTGTGELLRSVKATANLPNDVPALAVSPDGKTLASAAADGELRLWNIESGTPRRTLLNSRHSLDSEHDPLAVLNFAPDGKTLLSGSDKTLCWWDVASGKLKLARPLYAQAESMALSPDGQLAAVATGVTAATGARKWQVQLWDVSKGALLRTLPKFDSWSQPALVFAPDGKNLYLTANALVTVWDVASARKLREVKPPVHRIWDAGGWGAGDTVSIAGWRDESPQTIAISSDGHTAAGLECGLVRLWDISTGRDISVTPGKPLRPSSMWRQFEGEISKVIFAPNGKTLAGINATVEQGYSDKVGKVWLWDAATGARRWASAGNPVHASKIAFTRDGATMACAALHGAGFSGRTGAIWLWDMRSGKPRRRIPYPQFLAGLAISPDGKTVAGGDGSIGSEINRGAKVRWWDAETGRLRFKMPAHRESSDGLVFSPDGKTLFSGGGTLYRGDLMMWNVASGTLKKQLAGHPEGGVLALVRSPDGKLLASASWDNSVRLWDAQGNLKRSFKLLGGYVYTVEFSPDGRTLCAGTGGDNEGYCTLFNVSSGKKLWERKLKTDIYNVAFSPDGATLLVGTFNETALWDAKRGTLKRTLPDAGAAARFSPDGRFIVGLRDGGLAICDARDGKLLASVLMLPSPNGAAPQWLAYTPDGFYDGSPGAEKLLRWRVGSELQTASQHPERRRSGLLARVWTKQAQVAQR